MCIYRSYFYVVVCLFVSKLYVNENWFQDQYRLLGENVAKQRTDLMNEQLATFRSQLEDFTRKHKVNSIIIVFSPHFLT